MASTDPTTEVDTKGMDEVGRAEQIIRDQVRTARTLEELAEVLENAEVPAWAVRRAVTRLLYSGEYRLNEDREMVGTA